MKWFCFATFALILVPLARADLLPSNKSIPEVVDHYIDAELKKENITPAPILSDASFLRRVTLDLVGRIPSLREQNEFLSEKSPDKRVKLIDRLLQSPAYVRHQIRELDRILMEGTNGSVREYLEIAIKENRSWDRIFRELMLPDQKSKNQKGAREFLRQRARDVDLMTNQISVVFFGVNVSCAKCHDHPLVEDWKQDHFYGMKSFLNRTFDNGGFIGERDYGLVKFKTTKGKEHTAKLMFLTGSVVDDPRGMRSLTNKERQQEKKQLADYKRKKMPPPPPKFSARSQLVNLALKTDQRHFFSRSIVNRIWYRLFGRGLVMPLDQMHSANPASHPELIQWLARDLAENGYDLKRLIRGLVQSNAYARSSRWEKGIPPSERYFAMGQVRALTPEQLGTSIQLALQEPKRIASLKDADFEKYIEQIEGRGRGLAREIEVPTEDFQIGVGEALLFNNSENVQRDLLSEGGDRLIHRLKEVKNDSELIDLMMRNILCRPAAAEEKKILSSYLSQRKARRIEAIKQMVWALVTGAEMRFNH